jgi:hypothetical protein
MRTRTIWLLALPFIGLIACNPGPDNPVTPLSTTPSLVSSTPADGASKVKTSSGLILNFNVPIKPDSLTLTCQGKVQDAAITSAGVPDPCSLTLKNLGQATWSNDGKTASFTASGAPFFFQSTYSLGVAASDLAGNALAKDTHIGFASIPYPPTYLIAEPAYEKTVRDFRLKIRFSKPMVRTSVETAITFKRDQANVPVNASWSMDDRDVVFSPVSLVPYHSFMQALLIGRVESADGGEVGLEQIFSFTISSADQIKLTSDPAGDGYTKTIMNGNTIVARESDRTYSKFFVGDDASNDRFMQGYLTFNLPKDAIPNNAIIAGCGLLLHQADAPFGNPTDDFGPIKLYSVAFRPPLIYTADFPNPDPWNGSTDPFASVFPITPASVAQLSNRGMDPQMCQWQWDHRLDSNHQDALSYFFQYRLSYVTKANLTPISKDSQTDAISFSSSEDPEPLNRPTLFLDYRILDVAGQ